MSNVCRVFDLVIISSGKCWLLPPLSNSSLHLLFLFATLYLCVFPFPCISTALVHQKSFHFHPPTSGLFQVGPYVYRELREKVNITFNEDNSEVSYNEKISFFFEPSMSTGSEGDVVSNYNLPFIGTVSALQQAVRDGNPKARLAILLLNGKVMANKITLFTFNTVQVRNLPLFR